MTDYIAQEPKIPFQIQSYTDAGRHRFAHLINMIADHSPTGRAVLEDAAKAGYKLQMQAMSGTQGFVCDEMKTVFLSTCYDDDVLVETLAHECRHVQQGMKGMPDNFHEFVIRDAVKVNRAIEADAEVIGASVCYEIMKNGGNDAPLKALEKKVPKIVNGMMSASKGDEKVASPEMMRGAFDGWFKNKAIMDIYEKSVITNDCLSNSMRDYRDSKRTDFFKREMSSSEIVNMVCHDSAGKCYWSTNPDVMEEPARLQVAESTITFAESVNDGRAEDGLNVDRSYKGLYVYGKPLPAPAKTAEQPKTAGKQAAFNAIMARRKLSR